MQKTTTQQQANNGRKEIDKAFQPIEEWMRECVKRVKALEKEVAEIKTLLAQYR